MKGWKGEKVEGWRHYIKSKKQAMQYTYPFIGMGWVSPLQLLRSLLIKPLSGYAAHLSPWKGEKERGLLIPNWRSIYIFSSPHLFHFITFQLLTNCKFSHCQEIGSNLARVPIEATNLFFTRKNARILWLCISLIINKLHIHHQLLSSFYLSKTP